MEKPETEITGNLRALDDKTLDTALQAARDQARAFDVSLAPANQVLAQLEKSLPAGDKSAARDLAAAKMRFSSMRYDAEAALNQNVGYLLELQVRKANLSAERHHKRSGKFFFGMLAAQAAVVVFAAGALSLPACGGEVEPTGSHPSDPAPGTPQPGSPDPANRGPSPGPPPARPRNSRSP